MNKTKLVILLANILICSAVFAAPMVRGGMRGSNASFGLENHNYSPSLWTMGYGAALTTGANELLGYLSFNKSIGDPSALVPMYLTFGPAIAMGNGGKLGGFAHLGFENIFKSDGIFAEIGVDAMTPRGTGSGICLEIGYKY